MMKTLLRFVMRVLFGFRAFNENVLTTRGPVLLLPNHGSWFDWLFLLACADGDWKCVVSERTAQTSWLHRLIMINRRTFPIETSSPYALKRVAEFLAAGGRLALFPEGRLSMTGSLMKLFDGTGFLLNKTGAKIITCYLRGAHRLPASPNPNRKNWFPTVTAHFSEALIPPRLESLSNAHARTQLTNWLRDRMVDQQFRVEMEFGPKTLPEAIVETAARLPGRTAVEDGNASLSYRELVTAASLLARQLRRLLPAENKTVGVLLPNANAVPVVLLSIWSLGKAPAMLNFSTGPVIMLSCARLAGVKQIVTARTFLERAKLEVSLLAESGIEFIFLEDVRRRISRAARVRAFLGQIMAPGLRREEESRPGGPGRQAPEETTAVVFFTSGSEGAPKGVEVTHGNVLANVRQMLAVTDVTEADRVFNAMPVFHSLGLTVGTLLPLVRGLSVLLYPSPLHYRAIPTVLYFANCTILLGTNTFLNGYARKANPYDFRSLRYLFAAGEKLQESTAATWAQRFGVRVLEGYGVTECSPCVSVNTSLQAKYGSVGRLLPGMEYKLEPVEGVAEGGVLSLRGPNVMKGYLNPEANMKFQSSGGWYETGDVVRIDPEGYLFVQGRRRRFAKIGGEMVSLTAVEDALSGAFSHYGLRCHVAVVARSDEEKGEKLIAVSNEARLSLEEIRAVIKAQGLPNFAVPREVRFIDRIPMLGTGKTDHRELERLMAGEP